MIVKVELFYEVDTEDECEALIEAKWAAIFGNFYDAGNGQKAQFICWDREIITDPGEVETFKQMIKDNKSTNPEPAP